MKFGLGLGSKASSFKLQLPGSRVVQRVKYIQIRLSRVGFKFQIVHGEAKADKVASFEDLNNSMEKIMPYPDDTDIK